MLKDHIVNRVRFHWSILFSRFYKISHFVKIAFCKNSQNFASLRKNILILFAFASHRKMILKNFRIRIASHFYFECEGTSLPVDEIHEDFFEQTRSPTRRTKFRVVRRSTTAFAMMTYAAACVVSDVVDHRWPDQMCHKCLHPLCTWVSTVIVVVMKDFAAEFEVRFASEGDPRRYVNLEVVEVLETAGDGVVLGSALAFYWLFPAWAGEVVGKFIRTSR